MHARAASRSTASAVRCARRGSSPPPASSRSTTTSSGSPTTMRARGGSARRGSRQGVPVELDRVQSNFVQIDVAALGLGEWEAVALLARRGVALSRTMRPGVLRAVTHLDLSDDDVERAIELVPAALGAHVQRLRRSTGCSPSARPTGCRASPPQSCATARSSGRTRSARPTTTTSARRSRTRSTASARSRRRSPRRAIMQLRAEGAARSRRPARAAPRRDRERVADDPAHALSPLGPAARGRGDVRDRRVADRGASSIDSMAEIEFVSPPGRAAPLFELRVRAARAGGRAQARAALHGGTSTSGSSSPLGLERTTWKPRCAEGAGLPRRRVRTHRLGRAGDRPRRHGAGRSALVDGRAISVAGRRSSQRATTTCSRRRPSRRCGSRRSMYYPDDWVLGWGLGLMLYNQHGAIYGGHGGAMAGHLAGVFIDRKTKIGAAALTNSGTRGDMELFAISLAAKDDRALAAGDRAVAAGAGADRRMCGRCSGAGGPRATSSSSGGRAARLQRQGRRYAARARRDDVRARRRRLARRRAAASAASGCASTASGWSGPATRSRAPRSRSRRSGSRRA